MEATPTQLHQVRLSDTAAVPVLAALADEYARRYGSAEDEMAATSTDEFDPPHGAFLVLVDGSDTIAGGGIRRISSDTCEVKRMWTSPAHRRRGHAATILSALERLAVEAGYSRIVLETGPAQPEAHALYRRLGYAEIPAYGRYAAATAYERALVSPVAEADLPGPQAEAGNYFSSG